MVAKISLVKSLEQYEGVKSCLENIKDDIRNAISQLRTLTIKVNFVDSRKELSTTPYQAVRSFVHFISNFYKGEIIIAESPTWGVNVNGFEKYGFTELAEENPRVKFMEINSDETIEKKVKYPSREIKFPFSKSLLESPFLVSIARAKTHSSILVTLGLKNVFMGAVQGSNMRMKVHAGSPENLTHAMGSIAEFIYPQLVIIDGTIGMEGKGPVMGTKINAGWVVASLDALAADTLATYLMGFEPGDVDLFKILREKEMGSFYSEDPCEILGERPEKLISPFKPHTKFEKVLKEKQFLKNNKLTQKNLQSYKRETGKIALRAGKPTKAFLEWIKNKN